MYKCKNESWRWDKKAFCEITELKKENDRQVSLKTGKKRTGIWMEWGEMAKQWIKSFYCLHAMRKISILARCQEILHNCDAVCCKEANSNISYVMYGILGLFVFFLMKSKDLPKQAQQDC